MQEIALAPVLGLIPAHAGKTSWQAGPAPPTPAHPRSRGENRDAVNGVFARFGSSPLTRGKPEAGRPRREQGGLIPAHAGKTFAWVVGGLFAQAHPRSRGENSNPAPPKAAFDGSSPLTRGKLTLDDPEHVMRGLIPAHAGKT